MEPDTDRAPIYAWRQIFETFDAVCAADRPDQMLRTLPAELARPVRALIEAAQAAPDTESRGLLIRRSPPTRPAATQHLLPCRQRLRIRGCG